MSADHRFQLQAQSLGFSFEGEIKIGGHYVPYRQDGRHIHVSGQIPRMGDTVHFLGVAGVDIALPDARKAASVCAMRALALLRQAAGTLDAIESILRITVYVRSGAHFTQHSEVADGASDTLCEVLGDGAGAHTRTSVGVLQLPKGAVVELDLVAALKPPQDAP